MKALSSPLGPRHPPAWQGVVYETNGVERVFVITAPTELAARRAMRRVVRANHWQPLKDLVYPLRGTHTWHVATWTRHDGRVVKVEPGAGQS